MSLRLRCPAAGCGKMLKVPDAARGRTVRCPSCGSAVRATEPTPAVDEAGRQTVSHTPAAAGSSTNASKSGSTPLAAPLAPPTYEVLGELGRGGMGVVYQARQKALNRVVALKMILAGGHASVDLLARFRREAEAIARLQHPHIVQIFEVGEHLGLPFFSLEFCAGGSLERKLAAAPLSPKEAAALVMKLAQAVQAAHEKGVIHRDLKPANVLLAEDGTPKVSDFGLAKRLDEQGGTATGAVIGTPSYMAPEQAGGAKDAGPAADVYALGAILYECLTGQPPFRGASPMQTLLRVMRDAPVPPSRLRPGTPRDLEIICLRCLRKDPARRYGSARELAADLQRFIEGRPIQAPVGVVGRLTRWVRREPRMASASATAVLALAFAAAVLVVSLRMQQGSAEQLRAATDATEKANAAAAAEAEAGDLQHRTARYTPCRCGRPDGRWDKMTLGGRKSC